MAAVSAGRGPGRRPMWYPGAAVILDVRKGTDGRRQLETALGVSARTIADAAKHERLLLRLPGS